MDVNYGKNPATDTDDLEALIGEVQASPTANTVLDRLKALLTGIVLSAGTALIGKVSIDQATANANEVVVKSNTAVLQGNITLDGTAQQLHADTACKNVTIQAHPDNVDYVYVGKSDISTTVHMAVLSGGSSFTLTVSNLNLLYVRGTIAELVSYGGEV